MQGLSHPDTIIQANLANSVALKCLALRKPKPPIALGAHKLAHTFQAKKRLESLLGFHQKRLNEASNLSQIATGTSDEEKVYTGKAIAIDLIIVALPTHERVLHLRPSNLASSFSWRNLKSLILLDEWNRGDPRYLTLD